jgi:hypothetical protein
MKGAKVQHIDLSAQTRTSEQSQMIKQVLQRVAPLESSLLGSATVERISRGASFKASQGGRHLKMMEAIGHLVNIGTLVHWTIIGFQILRIRQRTTLEAKPQEPPVTASQIKEFVIQEASAYQELNALLTKDPTILDKILGELHARKP